MLSSGTLTLTGSRSFSTLHRQQMVSAYHQSHPAILVVCCVLGSGWMLTPHFIVGVLLTELRLRPQQLLVMTLLTPRVYIPPARKIVSFPDPNPRPRLPAAVMVWDTGPFCIGNRGKGLYLHLHVLPLTSFPLQ